MFWPSSHSWQWEKCYTYRNMKLKVSCSENRLHGNWWCKRICGFWLAASTLRDCRKVKPLHSKPFSSCSQEADHAFTCLVLVCLLNISQRNSMQICLFLLLLHFSVSFWNHKASEQILFMHFWLVCQNSLHMLLWNMRCHWCRLSGPTVFVQSEIPSNKTRFLPLNRCNEILVHQEHSPR